MSLEIKIVSGKDMLKEYIMLPSVLHASYAGFVPPFYKDEFEFHDPSRNLHLRNSTYARFLSYVDNRPVGRIMGIIFHPWNANNGVMQARFYQLDCIAEREVCGLLLQTVEQWAIEQGMNEIIGPFGFSDKDPQGLQVEGFEFPPVIASVSHQPYLAGFVSGAGFSKFKDCVSYRMVIPDIMPDFYRKIYDRTLKNHELKVLQFKKTNELRPYFIPVMKLMNEAYRNIFGFVPMTEDDITKLANQYLSVLDPGLVKIVINNESTPVAFVIAMANISQGIKKARGKLFPLGFIYILIAMKKSRQLDLLLGAVADAYRGRGLNVLLGITLMETARKKGLEIMDSHLVLEENWLMRAELEKLGGNLSKRYRIFRKTLN